MEEPEKLGVQPKVYLLRPKHETLFTEGILSYGESQRAYNTIKLKSVFLKEFPQLSERRNKFGYRMVMYRSYRELMKVIKEMDKGEEVIPILLWFCKIN